MEALFYFFPALFILLLSIFLVSSKWKPTKNSTSNLPPGPRKLPIIGNFHNLAGSLPHRSISDLANKYGALMHLQLGQVPTIVVSSPEMAKEVLKTHDTIFSYRPSLLGAKIITYNYNDIVFAPYGNCWRQLRKICVTQLLSINRVKSFRSIREEEVRNLIKSLSLCQGSPVNLSKKVFSMIHTIVSRAAIGEKCKDQEKFISTAGESSRLSAGFCLADLYPSIGVLQSISWMRLKLDKLHKETNRILGDILNEHRERNEKNSEEQATEDIVDVLLKLQKNGELEFPLTDNNIKAVILNMFLAGSETSASVIEWTLSEMLRNPRVMAKAQAEVRQVFCEKGSVDETSLHELTYLKLVIKESLRLHPPVPLVPRECREKCLINGYEIPAKARVNVNVLQIGRDPGFWTEPKRFWPERFYGSSIDYKGANFEFIPFGAGRRICPGMAFGMANIELPLANLLFHFDWKLPRGMKPENLDMSEAFGLAVTRRNNLCLIPNVYSPET